MSVIVERMGLLCQRSGVQRRRVRAGACLALVALAGAAAPAFLGATESLPEVTSRGRAYFLPVSPARLVYRFGDEAPPEVLEFWQAHGREWQIYWDYRLGTPHALYPLTPVSIVAAPLVAATEGQGNGGSADLVKAVRQWIDGLSGFLGVDSSRLGEPFVDSMGKLVMVVFPQTTPSGIPIRGANVRVLLNRQGNLASLRAFVARGVDDPPGEVLSAETIAERTTARGSAVEASRLEMAFPTEEVSSALPIWSVDAIDPPPPGMDMPSSSEHIVDAYSGALLARTVVMKRFDGDGGGEEVRKVPVTGKVLAAAPDLSSIFLSPFDGGPRVDNVLRGALVRDTFQPAGQDAQHRPTATTDEDGKFAGVELNPPATLDLHAALEYGHFVKKNDPSTYVRVFEISPYGFPTHIDPLPGETNLVGGFLPHLTQSHAPEEPYEFRWNATSQPTDAVSIERVHWLMAYEAARRLVKLAEDRISSLYTLPPDTVEFRELLPIDHLCLVPIASGERLPFYDFVQFQCGQNYNTPSITCWTGEGPRPASILTGLFFDVTEDRDSCTGGGPGKPEPMEPVVPTIIEHEVGHHLFWHLTKSLNRDPAGMEIEEGVADALVALANENDRIGYKLGEADQPVPTARGFSLEDPFSGAFRSRARQNVGEGFWRLDDSLKGLLPPEPAATGELIFHWLSLRRVSVPEDLAFAGMADIVEDLLLADDSRPFDLRANGDPRDGTPHDLYIRQAFAGRAGTDTPFIRGDASLDQRLDVTDAIVVLNVAFRGEGEQHDCWNALDADDDGKVTITDAIRILGFLFLGSDALPPPSGKCGLDPSPPDDAGNLGCREYTCPL